MGLINPVTTSKRNAYLVDLGTGTDRNLLPLGIGLISSYCNSILEIRENYNIDLRFLRVAPKEFVNSLEKPVVVGFACYAWNFNASISMAWSLKQKFPKCQIVFGAYSVPSTTSRMETFFKKHPYVDTLVHNEGELTFANLLLSFVQGRPLSTVQGISYRCSDVPEGYIMNSKREESIQLDSIPSPFLSGTFDALMRRSHDQITGIIWETSRDCPYPCTFCAWGKTDGKSIRKFNLDRLYDELDWMGRNKIVYVSGSDANFGMFYQRDLEIAEKVVKVHRDTGFPRVLNMMWAKNSNEKVMRIADALREGGLNARLLISVQSFSKEVGNAVKRSNISSSRFVELKKMYHHRNQSTLTEIILGLPMESYETFRAGLERVMEASLTDHFLIYPCCIIDGTEMAEPDYLEKYKIETRKVGIGLERVKYDPMACREQDEIVVATSTLPLGDWKRAYVFGFSTLALYNFPLTFFVVNYLHQTFGIDRAQFFEFLISETASKEALYPRLSIGINHIRKQYKSILDNKNKLFAMPQLRGLSVPPADGALILFLEDSNVFYDDIQRVTKNFCKTNNHELPLELLEEIVLYQKIRIPVWPIPKRRKYSFSYNIPKYFQSLLHEDKPVSIKRSATQLEVIIPKTDVKDSVDFVKNRVFGSYKLETYKVA